MISLCSLVTPLAAQRLVHTPAQPAPLVGPGSLEDFAISVKDCGARGDGVTDDTVAIQATIAKIQLRGGGLVFFPAGRYRTTATLRISASNVALGGLGGASVLAPAGNFDSIVVQSSSPGVHLYNDRVSDLTIDETGKTGGRLLVGDHVAQFISERLIASAGWSGMVFNNFNNVTLYHARLTDYRGGAGAAYVRLTGGANGVGRSDVAFLLRAVFGGTMSLGMRGLDIDGFVHTVNGASCHFVNIGGEALHTRNTIGAPQDPAFVTMDDFESDYSHLEAVRLDNGLRVFFNNMQINGARSRAGIYVGGLVRSCSFTGGFVSGSQQAGIAIAGKDVTVSGAVFLFNSSDQFGGARGVYPGILIGGTSLGVVVTGCRSGEAATANYQRHGCQIDTGADDFVVTGNNFRNNVNAGVLNGAGTGATRLVANNI
jgi:hypothetical protein